MVWFLLLKVPNDKLEASGTVTKVSVCFVVGVFSLHGLCVSCNGLLQLEQTRLLLDWAAGSSGLVRLVGVPIDSSSLLAAFTVSFSNDEECPLCVVVFTHLQFRQTIFKLSFE